MTQSPFVKDTGGFIPRPGALEAPLERQTGLLTPNDAFFVCSVGATPIVDAGTWRLAIEGDAVTTPLALSYDDLLAMEQHTLPVYVECAGNHRALFETVMHEPLNRRPHMEELLWTLGGVGMATWRGVRLRDVLARAGIKDDAYHVCPIGLDRDAEEPDGVRVPMTAEKALHPDTLIALFMNGEPLPPDHGFPARTIVPGWVGTYSIKWLARIVVSSKHMWVVRNTERYVLMGDAWPADDFAPARGAPITRHPIRSSLALPWPASLERGRREIRGFARGAEAPIVEVTWSADGGATWRDAELLSPTDPYVWVAFAFAWDATPGDHALMTRATDANGDTQPMTQPFNNGGYLFAMVHPHPVVVR